MDGLDQSPLWGVIGIIIGLIIYFIRKDKNIIFYARPSDSLDA